MNRQRIKPHNPTQNPLPAGKGRNLTAYQNNNPIEAIKTVGADVGRSLKQDLITEGAEEAAAQLRQLFGFEKPQSKLSGTIPEEGVDIDSVINQKPEEAKQQAKAEEINRLLSEEKAYVEQKEQELKKELQAIMEEISNLTQSMDRLSQEVEIATKQEPPKPGKYHIGFFRKLLLFLISFRQKIEDSAVWLEAWNNRAAKKGMFWAQVGKAGAKRLLSQEDYAVTRSAG